MKLLVYDGTQWRDADYIFHDSRGYLYTYNGSSWPTQRDYPPELVIYQYDSYSGWQQTY